MVPVLKQTNFFLLSSPPPYGLRSKSRLRYHDLKRVCNVQGVTAARKFQRMFTGVQSQCPCHLDGEIYKSVDYNV